MSSPLLSLRSRARALSPRTVDAVLVVLMVAVTAFEVSTVDASAGQRAAVALPLALVAAGVLVRRTEPLLALGLALAGIIGTSPLAEEIWRTLNVVYIGLLFVTYSMASRESGRRLWIGIGMGIAGVTLMTLAVTGRTEDSALLPELLLGPAFFVLVPVVPGRLIHSRQRLTVELRAKTELIEADRAGRAREAAAAERARIAGELHDVVAHALGAMTIQATGARRLAAVKPERAGEAFSAIEVAGRGALSELRTLLDALRDDEAQDPLHESQPTLDGLEALAARARAAGLGVRLAVAGTRPGGLPAGVDATAYRIVQDALRAALEQGGAGAATVRVRFHPSRIEVEVLDDGVHDDGRRLLGLRERVSLYGGEVHAGCEDAGGHAVRAWLPVETAA